MSRKRGGEGRVASKDDDGDRPIRSDDDEDFATTPQVASAEEMAGKQGHAGNDA